MSTDAIERTATPTVAGPTPIEASRPADGEPEVAKWTGELCCSVDLLERSGL